MREWWTKLRSVDLRSLACFRLLLGAFLLVNLLTRLDVVSDFYTDDGFLPRDARISLAKTPWVISLHFSSGNMLVIATLFLFAILFAIGVAVGYRTRYCAVGSWILFCSMHARNPFVDALPDDVLLALLFWAMFVPLGACWSIDAARTSGHQRLPTRYSSWGVEALILQVFVIVLTAALTPQIVFASFARNVQLLLICAVAGSIFLPARLWSWLERHLAPLSDHPAGVPRWLAGIVGGALKWLRGTRVSEAPMWELGTGAKVVVVAAMSLILAGTASNLSGPGAQLPSGVQAAAIMSHLGQPCPAVESQTPAEQGWYVIEGVRTDGKRVNVWNGAPVDYARPAELDETYGDPRLGRYLTRLASPAMAGYRPYYAGYLCRKWNERYVGSNRLEQINIHYMREPTSDKLFLLHYACPKPLPNPK